jgi:hypothetical protein
MTEPFHPATDLEEHMSTPASPYLPVKGVIATLFDFSFTTFLAAKIIKLLYMVFVGIAAIVTIVAIVAAFSTNSGLGVLALLVSPVLFLVLVALYRIALELVQVFFAIEENSRTLVAISREQGRQ